MADERTVTVQHPTTKQLVTLPRADFEEFLDSFRPKAPAEMTLKELQARARELEIEGRSNMSRQELVDAIAGASQ